MLSLAAQQQPERVGGSGPDKVLSPSLIEKVEPEHTEESRGALVQGKVLIAIVVDIDGKARDIEVISPLGYGLDESAVRAVQKWRFRPGTKGGQPVPVFGTIEVNFRFLDVHNDWKTEELRTKYNHALSVRRRTGTWPDHTGMLLQELAKRKNPDGMFLYGAALRDGTFGETDVARGSKLIEDSAKKNHGPALYLLGLAHYRGIFDKTLDVPKGIEYWKRASLNGSTDAQAALAELHESGRDVPLDLDRARQLYLMCAARGNAKCQSRYGSLTLAKARRNDFDLVRAVAWLELASEGGDSSAAKRLPEVRALLSEKQVKDVAEIKSRLVHK